MQIGRFHIDFGVITLPIIVMVATALAGSTFFIQSSKVMSQKIREELLTSAVLSARLIDGDIVETIQNPEDQQKPEYLSLVRLLRDIRDNVPNARFVYIFRRTVHPQNLAFVADADALSVDSELDVNGNGQLDSDEVAGTPGELYDISEQPELQGPAFIGPVTTNVYTDQWGSLLSGFAPIYNKRGKVVAVLGIDMDADEFLRISQSAFSPFSLFLVLFMGALGSAVLGYSAWHRRMQFYERLDSERSSLVGLAMHQIGAPLSSMRWWIDILKEADKDHPNNENAEAYAQLDESIARMSDLIEALRKATSFSQVNTTANRARVTLYEVLQDAIEEQEPNAKKKDQKINLIMEQETFVNIDRKLIGGVVTELIANAISYSPEHTMIDVEAVRHTRQVTVTVRDKGAGIPAKDLPNIFQEFTRGSNATKLKPVGNGLGLFTSRRIIELAGGKMWIESEEGKGTAVHFTLPVA